MTPPPTHLGANYDPFDVRFILPPKTPRRASTLNRLVTRAKDVVSRDMEAQLKGMDLSRVKMARKCAVTSVC